jgi:hypothetical protein
MSGSLACKASWEAGRCGKDEMISICTVAFSLLEVV